jgi:NADH-quinone oxidoreductase subunit I
MLCARQCPDWCIYIEGHKEKRPPRRAGGRERTVSPRIADFLHDKDKLGEWMATVPSPEPLERGAEVKGKK